PDRPGAARGGPPRRRGVARVPVPRCLRVRVDVQLLERRLSRAGYFIIVIDDIAPLAWPGTTNPGTESGTARMPTARTTRIAAVPRPPECQASASPNRLRPTL